MTCGRAWPTPAPGGCSPRGNSPGLKSQQDGEGVGHDHHRVHHRDGASLFDANETGKGWAVCSAYCQPAATFAAQAEPLADVQKLQ